MSRNKTENFNLKDLEGKKILGGRNGGMPAMTLNYTLNQNNVNAEVDTSVDFANLSGAFIGGQGDLVTLFEPNALSLEKEDLGYVVKSVGEIGGEVPYTTFNALKSYIDENPTIIKGFNDAIQKGINYTKNHSNEELATLLVDYFPDTSLNDISIVIGRYRDIDAWYDSTYITEEGFNHMQDIVEFNGFLDKRVDYNTLVRNQNNE